MAKKKRFLEKVTISNILHFPIISFKLDLPNCLVYLVAAMGHSGQSNKRKNKGKASAKI